jgi:hypothetical protein
MSLFRTLLDEIALFFAFDILGVTQVKGSRQAKAAYLCRQH